MPGPVFLRGRTSGTAPHESLTGRSVNEGRPHWTETCSYCGMALPKADESCPTELIDRAADALIGEKS